ncbi:N-acetylglucosamine-6-phosphate deacetylase [Fictibacillus iocasae]|uniref:N-acetylglucosamine-6-phosphate deacetylase n=1 Tax=Fictibacillus iocasae TaxID=2715437 RepID=A0ABW2NRS1_9BACL
MTKAILFSGDMMMEGGVQRGWLLVEGSTISYVGKEKPDTIDPLTAAVDLPDGSVLLPGMIDLHIHGAAGADVMDGTEEALHKISRALPKEGTTSFLATTMTEREDVITNALSKTAAYMKNQPTGQAELLGIHLEGPFISPKRAGAQPKDFIIAPNVDTFRRYNEAAENHVKLVTLAPEEPGGYELASYLQSKGIIASIGHSDADYHEVVKSVEAGVTHGTHLYNGMRGIHHRDPGTAGGVLLLDEIMAEIIADGVHCDKEMVKMAYKLKGSSKLVLVTDAMRAKCLGDGMYTLGGQAVKVEDGKAMLSDGTLAGSVLSMNDAVQNVITFTGCSFEEIAKMTSENPAKELQIFDRKGSLAKGKDADLTIIRSDGAVLATYCCGKKAYEIGGE